MKKNIYRLCKEFVSLKREKDIIVSKKHNAVHLEYYEEASIFYKKELEMDEKLAKSSVVIENIFLDHHNHGVDESIAIAFKRSILSDIIFDINTTFKVNGMMEMKYFNNMIDNYNNQFCYLVDFWIEFFTERRDYLKKQLLRVSITLEQKIILEQELFEINKELFNNPPPPHKRY
jgi:hypothetical protein